MRDSSFKSDRNYDMKLYILILQTVAVAIILLFALGIRIFGGELYLKIKTYFHERFDDTTRVSDVIEQSENEVVGKDVYDKNEFKTDDDGITDKIYDEPDVGVVEEEYDLTLDSDVTGNITDSENVGSTTVAAQYNSFLWPVYGTVSSRYGFRNHPISGEYLMHNGIDIAADSGTEIISVYDGVVEKSGYSESYGYYLLLKHSNNLETLYAHCSKLIVKSGDEIKRGETIALVGSSGRSTGPHLHFEVRVGNYRVNPEWLLSKRNEI